MASKIAFVVCVQALLIQMAFSQSVSLVSPGVENVVLSSGYGGLSSSGLVNSGYSSGLAGSGYSGLTGSNLVSSGLASGGYSSGIVSGGLTGSGIVSGYGSGLVANSGYGSGLANSGYGSGFASSGFGSGLAGSGLVSSTSTGGSVTNSAAAVNAATGLNVVSGSPLTVTSFSPIGPSGIAVAAENTLEGILQVNGQLPFLSAVAFEGALPTAGSGVAQCGCGDGQVGIIKEGLPQSGGIAGRRF